MSFRARLTLVATGAVAIAIVLASLLLFVVVRDQLYNGIDNSLHDDVASIANVPPRDFSERFYNAPGFAGSGASAQIVESDGTAYQPPGPFPALPVTDRILALARVPGSAFFMNARVGGRRYRIYTARYPYANLAIQVGRPLDEVDRAVERTRTILFLAGLVGIGLAAMLGLLVSGAALAPIRRLTRATEVVTETGDLSQRIEVHGRDELSLLAMRFNAMLAALEESTRAQQQLVADASHELRTPLTSLRTNIEVLAQDRPLPPGERERLLADVLEQLGEMTALITELMELARGEQHVDELRRTCASTSSTESAVERVQRNRPSVVFETDLRRVADARRARRRSSGRSGTCSTTRPSGARPAAPSR